MSFGSEEGLVRHKVRNKAASVLSSDHSNLNCVADMKQKPSKANKLKPSNLSCLQKPELQKTADGDTYSWAFNEKLSIFTLNAMSGLL